MSTIPQNTWPSVCYGSKTFSPCWWHTLLFRGDWADGTQYSNYFGECLRQPVQISNTSVYTVLGLGAVRCPVKRPICTNSWQIQNTLLNDLIYKNKRSTMNSFGSIRYLHKQADVLLRICYKKLLNPTLIISRILSMDFLMKYFTTFS